MSAPTYIVSALGDLSEAADGDVRLRDGSRGAPEITCDGSSETPPAHVG